MPVDSWRGANVHHRLSVAALPEVRVKQVWRRSSCYASDHSGDAIRPERRYNPLMLKRWMPALWIVGLYFITAVTEGLDLVPDLWWQRVLFELRHIAVHAFAFAVGGLLIRFANNESDLKFGREELRVLLVLLLFIGIGQEALQSIMRERIAWIGSPVDLAVDVAGGLLGLRLYSRVEAIVTRWQETQEIDSQLT